MAAQCCTSYEGLVVEVFFELGLAARARDQALRPEEHHEDEDHAEDPELVQRHVDVNLGIARSVSLIQAPMLPRPS